MRRICILTPGHIASTPRVVKEAAALAEAGHAVTVISGRTLSSLNKVDQSIADQALWSWRTIDFRTGWRWKSARLVQALATAAFNAGLPTAGVAASAATPRLRSAAMAVPADVYIAHYIAALPAAAEAARRHGGKCAFDAEDFHAGEFADHAFSLKRQVVQDVESRHLSGCSWITAASPGIADAYAKAYGLQKPTVVLNVFPKSQAPQSPTAEGSFRPAPSVYWFSQTIGPDRGLETAIRAIAVSKARPHLVLRGQIAQSYEAKLLRLAASEGVGSRIHFLPTAPPSEMLRLAGEYDVGLCAETGHTFNRRIAITNKIFTYLQAGVPVLMSDIEAHRRLAQDLGSSAALYGSENTESLAAAMDEFLLNKTRLAVSRAEAFRLGQDTFNWDSEKMKLHRLVQEHLESAHEPT
jgi:glycosyltransferase involved in cell wall biosynthesis